MNHGEDNEDRALEASQRFIQRLKSLHRREVTVPVDVDAAILNKAREHLQGLDKGRRILPFPRWLAAAAAVVLVATVAGVWFQKRPVPFAREDLDRNGRVDVLDAFWLARKVQQGAVSTEFDLNGDGVVNARDIDAVVIRAVKLEGKQG